MKRKDVYQTVTNNIIQALENGIIPWKKPYKSSFSPIPVNHFTGKVYRGINVFLLNLACIQRGYPTNAWLTYRQTEKLGGHVTKGEVSEDIVFWKKVIINKTKSDEDESASEVAFIARIYHVFNIEQCEGIQLEQLEIPQSPNFESCEAVYANYPEVKPKINSSISPMYIPKLDQIRIPAMRDFISTSDYYATLFHEFVHSTGHVSRLKREGVANVIRSDKIKYSIEELIAEMGASFLCALTGIDNVDLTDNAAAYIHSWLEVFKQDNKMVVKAASKAQSAVDYISGFLN